MIRFFTLLAALWLAGAADAAAHGNGADEQCRARLAPPGRVSLDLADPLSGAASAEAFELELRNISDGGCRFTLAVEEGRRGGGLRRRSGAALDFRIARDAAGAEVLFDSRQPGAGPRAALRAPRRDLRLFLIVNPGDAPRAGEYSADVRLTLRNAENDVVDQAALELEARVPEQVQAFISGASQSGGAYALLDLEELTTGEIGRATLRIRSTSDVRIKFDSEHEGRLARAQGGRISYDLSADGAPVDLRQGGRRGYGVEASIPLTAREIDLQVRVGDTARAPAGEYRDRITITVTAQ